ncbi:hypothetical protein AB0F88_09850 [Streptosporangium sp. NPDC023963]
MAVNRVVTDIPSGRPAGTTAVAPPRPRVTGSTAGAAARRSTPAGR